MAAGLGFKTFTTGEVLTAADTNGYLMQGVLVFASAAARDAAITSPQEGQCCYLKDTDAVLTYSGSTWVGFDDSNAIQNTIVDAKGDIVAASAADTPARLAVGTNGQVLIADSSAGTGLAWAIENGMTTLSSGSLASGGTSLTSIAQTYKDLVLVIRNFFPSGAGSGVRVRINNNSTGIYDSTRIRSSNTTTSNATSGNAFYLDDNTSGPALSDQGQAAVFTLLDYTNTNTRKLINCSFFYQTAASADVNVGLFGAFRSNSAITQIDIAANAGNLSGTYILYGVK